MIMGRPVTAFRTSALILAMCCCTVLCGPALAADDEGGKDAEAAGFLIIITRTSDQGSDLFTRRFSEPGRIDHICCREGRKRFRGVFPRGVLDKNGPDCHLESLPPITGPAEILRLPAPGPDQRPPSLPAVFRQEQIIYFPDNLSCLSIWCFHQRETYNSRPSVFNSLSPARIRLTCGPLLSYRLPVRGNS